LIPTI